MDEPKNKGGRPSVYQDWMPEELKNLMDQGWLDVQVYARWDVCKDTFYRWLREKPELEEAYKKGLAKCEAHYLRKAQDCLEKGDDKGFKFFISIMNNKFAWEKGSKSDGGTTNNITIGNMNVLQQKSREDLLDYIQLTIDKHKDVLNVELIEHKQDDQDRYESDDGQGSPESS